RIQQLRDQLGLSARRRFRSLLGAALAEVVVFGGQTEVFLALLAELLHQVVENLVGSVRAFDGGSSVSGRLAIALRLGRRRQLIGLSVTALSIPVLHSLE